MNTGYNTLAGNVAALTEIVNGSDARFTIRSENGGIKGSRRNDFTDLGVEAPDWQGAKTREYGNTSRSRNAARRDASAAKM